MKAGWLESSTLREVLRDGWWKSDRLKRKSI